MRASERAREEGRRIIQGSSSERVSSVHVIVRVCANTSKQHVCGAPSSTAPIRGSLLFLLDHDQHDRNLFLLIASCTSLFCLLEHRNATSTTQNVMDKFVTVKKPTAVRLNAKDSNKDKPERQKFRYNPYGVSSSKERKFEDWKDRKRTERSATKHSKSSKTG